MSEISANINNEEYLPLVPKNNGRKHLKRRTSEILFVIFMLFLPTLQFVLFWILPNIESILMAFKKEGMEGLTLYQFEKFFDYFKPDPLTGGVQEKLLYLFYAVRNSLIYFAINIFVCTPLVVFLSYILFRKVPMHGLFRVIFFLPSIIGGTVLATLYYQLFRGGGALNAFIMKLGFIEDTKNSLLVNPNTAFLMVLIYSIWTCVGLNMIMFYGAMKRIPNEIFESAEIDGVGFFRQFFEIVVPLIWPTISTLVVFSLAGIFVSYGPIMIICPDVEEASMIGWYIYKLVAIREAQDLNLAAAIGLLFTAIGLPFVLFVRWLLNKIGQNVEY